MRQLFITRSRWLRDATAYDIVIAAMFLATVVGISVGLL